jgi:carboxyl-terminal processing protease
LTNRRKIIFGAVALVLVTFLMTSSLFIYMFQVQSTSLSDASKLIKVLAIIKSRYVEEVPVSNLMSGAVKGLVSGLNDPHSVYMDAKVYKEFQIETEGSFGGVGIVIGMKEGKGLTVVAPIEGTPGERAGIKSGDLIIKIDGHNTKDMNQEEAVNNIRGPEGSQVTLAIKREGESELKDYVLIRANIQLKTVSGKMLENGVGYIRIAMFNETTSPDFNKVFQDLANQGMKVIILDLRDNPGGLLDECVKVARQLVPKGPIVSVVGRDGKSEVHSSYLEQVKYPLAVLVNGGSASASEIVAGAVQDTKSGTLIGSKTYGKGSVQTIFALNDGTAVKLTIAKYLTPGGRSINGKGVEPDIEVVNPEGKDLQLQKALEIVKSKM